MEVRGTPATGGVTNLVLVGKTGNGKSATGNSIVGRKAFKSLSGPFPVTGTCQLEQVTTKEGRKLNVIDTPGLYNPTVTLDSLSQDIAKCMGLAKEGLHGVLLVLSVKNRFNSEEPTILETLQTLFGEKIISYIVVIFTGGDELEENEETLEDYLRGSPRWVQELLPQCNNRKVLFNNKSKSKIVKERQVTELLKQIDIVISENGGRPYSNEMFREAQESSRMRKEQKQILLENMEKQQHAEQLKKSEKARLEFEEQVERDSREKISLLEQKFEQRLEAEQLKFEQHLESEQFKFEQHLEAEQCAREEVERDSREKISLLEQKMEQRLEAEQSAREEVKRDSREKISMLNKKFEQHLESEQSKFEQHLEAEQCAREEVERDSREKVSLLEHKLEQRLEAEQSAREEVERDSREKISMLNKKFEQHLESEQFKFEQHLEAEQCAREEVERDSREKVSLLEHKFEQHLEAEQSAREQIERDSREKIRLLEQKFEERLTAEQSAREQVERDSREKMWELQQKSQITWPVCVIL